MKEIPEEDMQPQQCQYCSEEFPSKMKKDLHVAKEHLDKLLTCEPCRASFTSFSDFRRHTETSLAHANQKNFPCDICEPVCTSSSQLKCHREKVHYEEIGLEPHRCSHCGKVLANKSILKRHITSMHTKQFKLTREYCGKGFIDQHWMLNHIAAKHQKNKASPKKGK